MALLILKEVEFFPSFSLTTNFIGGSFLKSQNSKEAIDLSYHANDDHFFSFGCSYEKVLIIDVYTATTHDLFTLAAYEESIKLRGEQNFNDERSREIACLYVQDQFYINQNWEVTAGIRYDYYNDFGKVSFNAEGLETTDLEYEF
ncbi:TonB-dependent receptor [Paraglaciecola sp.]|uniref:TonB-dependent receptor n=1 Tax=Paraglaciecola sp. TaxID=1920173 RepID=UPI0030F3AA10